MKRKAVILAAALVLAGGAAWFSYAQDTCPADLGERLVRDLWAKFAAGDWAAVEASMADGFQSIHSFGANDKLQEFTLLQKLNLSDYTLDDFLTTQQGDVLVVTYSVTVAETIHGERLEKAPAPRMTVFVETDEEWKWLAHANLRPMEEDGAK